MERDGWPDLPMFKFATPGSLRILFQNLLGLLRRHNSLLKFSWVKGHSGVYGNERADKAAALGVKHSHFVFSVSQSILEPGWMDSAPVLNHQPLSHLTYLIVRDSVPPPSWAPNSLLSASNGSLTSMMYLIRTLICYVTSSPFGLSTFLPACVSSFGSTPLGPSRWATGGMAPLTSAAHVVAAPPCPSPTSGPAALPMTLPPSLSFLTLKYACLSLAPSSRCGPVNGLPLSGSLSSHLNLSSPSPLSPSASVGALASRDVPESGP